LTRIGEEIGAVIEYNFSIEPEFDAFYFLYGLLVPRWHHALGQLLNFLAYDLVLIVPFLWLFKTAKPEYVFSLIVYVAVLKWCNCSLFSVRQLLDSYSALNEV